MTRARSLGVAASFLRAASVGRAARSTARRRRRPHVLIQIPASACRRRGLRLLDRHRGAPDWGCVQPAWLSLHQRPRSPGLTVARMQLTVIISVNGNAGCLRRRR